MKPSATTPPALPPHSPFDQVNSGDPSDTATLALLAAWQAEDATTDPAQLRAADEDIAAFKKAMNENRAATSAHSLFP